MISAPLVKTSGSLLQNNSDYIVRLMNSALSERHVDPRWHYSGPTVFEDIFLEVAFAPELTSCPTWSRDYRFLPVSHSRDSLKPSVSVHTDLSSLAKRHGVAVNDLHSFMHFTPARAVVRTLLIELETPGAQHGERPDEADISREVSKIISTTSPSGRRMILTRTTTAGPNFADRALVLCLVKLYAHLESCNRWRLGSTDSLSTIEMAMSIVGLFCNAWTHAPTIDICWSRLSSSCYSSLEKLNDSKTSSYVCLTPEVWFEWSLAYDPWVRQTDTIQLLSPRDIENSIAPPIPEPPVMITKVSQPDPENEGRVVVTYLSKPEEERWSFRAILDSRWVGKKPQTGLQYLVDWEYAEPSWQPARDLQGCEPWVLQFHRECPEKAGPVAKLKHLL